MSEQQPPAYAWAQPVEEVRWVETEPLEYHQLLRGAPRYRWWKPLVGLLLGVIYYFTLALPFTLLAMGVHFGLSGTPMTPDALEVFLVPDTQQPATVFVALASIVLMIPAVWLAMLSVGLRPVGRAWSVALKLRWGLLARTLVPAIAALVLMNVLGIGLEILFSGDLSGLSESVETGEALLPAGFSLEAALWSMLWVLLLVPVQAAAEELVFRGAFIQGLGAWLGAVRGSGALAIFARGPWLPVLISSIVFGFSHIYDVWGWLHVVAMAVTAGWLAWRTGGLEAAISIHVINNLIAFGILAAGFTGETGQTADSGGTIGSLIGSLAGFALFAWWVERIFKKHGGPRTRIDYVEARRNAPAGYAMAPAMPAAAAVVEVSSSPVAPEAAPSEAAAPAAVAPAAAPVTSGASTPESSAAPSSSPEEPKQ